jgi:hypothetical protein
MYPVNVFILVYMLIGAGRAWLGWNRACDKHIDPIVISYSCVYGFEWAWRMYIIFTNVIIPWPYTVWKYGW